MPSLEGKISEEMAAIMLGCELAQADHSKERDALAERLLLVLKGKMEAPPNRDPIYKDDLPHR